MKGVDCRTALVSCSVAAKPILRCQMSGFATLAIGVNIETPFEFSMTFSSAFWGTGRSMKKHDHHKYSKMFFSPQFPWRDQRLHRSWIDYPIVPWQNMAWWQHVATVLGFTSNSHGKMGAFPPAILAHLWASPPAKQTEAVFQADSQIAADLHRLCTNSKLSKFSSS